MSCDHWSDMSQSLDSELEITKVKPKILHTETCWNKDLLLNNLFEGGLFDNFYL